MSNTVSIVLIFVLAGIVYVHSRSMFVPSDDVELWKKQKEAVEQFNCQPRPRSFRVSEELAEFKNEPNTIPSEVILHRCDSQSGCCQGKGVCTVVKTEPVKLALFSYNIEGVITVEGNNHTECSCQRQESGTIKK